MKSCPVQSGENERIKLDLTTFQQKKAVRPGRWNQDNSTFERLKTWLKLFLRFQTQVASRLWLVWRSHSTFRGVKPEFKVSSGWSIDLQKWNIKQWFVCYHQSAAPVRSTWLQTKIRTCKHSVHAQISHSWVTFKPWHCPWCTRNICVDLVHKSQLATATKRPGERQNCRGKSKNKTYSLSKMRPARRKRCGDSVHCVWKEERALGIKEEVRLEGFNRDLSR